MPMRAIEAAAVRDRVVHHALCRVVEPIFDKRLIYDTYACRLNKGRPYQRKDKR